MKKLFIYCLLLLSGALTISCNEDPLDPNSIFKDPDRAKTDFDKYLEREFVIPYNIKVNYRLVDVELDHTYQVIPAEEYSSKVMAVLLKHLWIDVYAEASPDGYDFMRTYAVRVVQFVGSGQFQYNSVILGTAEGGKKITLTQLNRLNPNEPKTINANDLLANKGEFQVIHHEFAHILHQMKNYSTNFQLISGGYVGDEWVNISDRTAHVNGFLTPYAMSQADEDFVETLSIYITSNDSRWNALLVDAGTNGAELINKKLSAVREYLKTNWSLNIDQLRDIILRRAGEIGSTDSAGVYSLNLDFVNLK